MNDPSVLARRLMALDDRLAACMKCGFCQQVCPVYGTTMMEADVARGKLALVSNLAHEMLRDPRALADKLGRCLLCGSCEAACPSGAKIMDVFLSARELVHEYIGLSPAKKAVFRGLLTRPALFDLAMRAGSAAQAVVFRKTGDAQNTTCAPMLAFMLGDRHIRRLAARPLHARVGALNEPRASGGLKVAFYPGCLGDKLYVEMAEACLKVLKHHRTAVFMPKGLACCGIPALSSGDVRGMLGQMRHNLELLDQGRFDYLVTPCASCASTIVEYWPKYAGRLGDGLKKLADDLAARTMDITRFLVDVIHVEAATPAADATPVTYHDPCHLKKTLGVSVQPRTVLSANPACRLEEMAEADRCCGCGGSFNLFHYDLSRRIGQRKRDNVAATGARVVATSCPACMMQLEDVLSHNHDDIVVKHPAELYAETLK